MSSVIETVTTTTSSSSEYGLTSSESRELHKSSSSTFKVIITSSWMNILLIFLPLGYIAYGLKWSDTWIFILNFFAIIPLAKLLGFATEDVSLRVGEVFITN
jgi:Ca2+:H+ antiporter